MPPLAHLLGNERQLPLLSGTELDDLAIVLDNAEVAELVGAAPGGWRGLSEHELGELIGEPQQQRIVLALQRLVLRAYPIVRRQPLASPAMVGDVYAARLADLRQLLHVSAPDGGVHDS